MSRTLQASLYERFESEPDKRVLGFYSFDGQLRWQTYQELYERGGAWEAWLREQGLNQGEVCILVLPSGELGADLLLAVLMRGAIPLLVAPPTLQGEDPNRVRVLNSIITRTRARLVIADSAMRSLAPELRGGARKIRFLDPAEVEAPVGAGDPQLAMPKEGDVAAYQLTSGTTGTPRVCVWKQASVLAALDGMSRAMDMRSDDVCVNWTPLYHDMGLVNNFLFCLTRGTPLVLMSPLDFVRKPALWLRALSESDATLTWSPNFGFAITAQRVRDREIQGVRLERVRAFWNAAERIHIETMQAFHERFAPIGVSWEALKTNFGCAENIGGASFGDPHGPLRVEHVDPKILHEKSIAESMGDPSRGSLAIVSAGRPYSGMEISILSGAGQPLPDGHVGEVALDTPSRMLGYLGNQRETRRALYGKLLRTGDMGYKRDGEFFWVGRVRERLSVRGRKLDPSDFEPALLGVPGLRHGCFVAFGVDDPKRGTQRVVIVTEVREPPELAYAEIPGRVRDSVLRQLGLAVDDVVLVPPGTLTKTSSGKRRHRIFRQMYIDGELEGIDLGTEGA